MKTINIVAGGPDHLIPDLLQYQDGDAIWVGVDRGAVTLLEAGIVPDEAFGDFDSITEEQKKPLKRLLLASIFIRRKKIRRIWILR